MSGSNPKLKVRTLDEMFKKISESSEEKVKYVMRCLSFFINKQNWGKNYVYARAYSDLR
jgi:hypothetical protein